MKLDEGKKGETMQGETKSEAKMEKVRSHLRETFFKEMSHNISNTCCM